MRRSISMPGVSSFSANIFPNEGEEGDGELFNQQLRQRWKSQEAMEALEKSVAETKRKKKAGSTVRVEGSSVPKRISKRLLIVALVASVVGCAAQFFLGLEEQAKLWGVVYAVLSLGLLDVCVAYHTPARWYWLHAAGNIVVAFAALPDLIKSFRHPTLALTGEPVMLPIYMIPAIHIYHLIFFRCSVADWVHHGVFAGLICPMGLFLNTGPVSNAVAFFICGLPGGLDYLMLAFIKHGWLSRLREKTWNARINVWLRSPGLIFCAATIYIASANGDAPWLASCLGALLCIVNGQYYMQVVVGNTFVKSRELLRPYNS